MKFLITGSSGFIGQNLVREVKRRFPDSQICCLVRKQGLQNPDNTIKYCSVNYLDINSLLNSEAFIDVDYIIHGAGVTKSATKEGFWAGNVIPTKNILETLYQKKIKPKRFILISSQSASGPSGSITHFKMEDEKENPPELYGQSKLAAEEILKQYGNDIPYTIVKPSSVYGPGDVDFFNIFKMTKMGINVFAGNADKYISIVYVDDLVDAIISSAISENTINKKYFICNDQPVTWRQVHEGIFAAAGKSRFDINVPSSIIGFFSIFGSLISVLLNKPLLLNKNKYKLSIPDYWISSNSNAKKDFGFSPKYNLAEGLKLTYDWYKSKGWL